MRLSHNFLELIEIVEKNMMQLVEPPPDKLVRRAGRHHRISWLVAMGAPINAAFGQVLGFATTAPCPSIFPSASAGGAATQVPPYAEIGGGRGGHRAWRRRSASAGRKR